MHAGRPHRQSPVRRTSNKRFEAKVPNQISFERQDLDERAGVETRVCVRYPSAQVAAVDLLGDHGVGQSEIVREALETAARQRRNVVVDLTHCGCIDSTVVKILLYGRTRMDAFGGRFALVIPVEPDRVATAAQLMGFKELFLLFTTIEEALVTVEHVTRVRDARARVDED